MDEKVEELERKLIEFRDKLKNIQRNLLKKKNEIKHLNTNLKAKEKVNSKLKKEFQTLKTRDKNVKNRAQNLLLRTFEDLKIDFPFLNQTSILNADSQAIAESLCAQKTDKEVEQIIKNQVIYEAYNQKDFSSPSLPTRANSSETLENQLFHLSSAIDHKEKTKSFCEKLLQFNQIGRASCRERV